MVVATFLTACELNAQVVVDTLWMEEHLDHELCWWTWEGSFLPELKGIPQAKAWNDSISRFESHVIEKNLKSSAANDISSSFCLPVEGEDSSFPRGEGLIGAFGFEILTVDDDVLSVLLKCNVHFNGGNLDWNECMAINIDTRTGKGILVQDGLDKLPSDMFDAQVRNCIKWDACSPSFQSYRHSIEFPDHVSLALAENRVGLREGMWVSCQDLNPFSWCAHLAQTICVIDLACYKCSE